MGSFKEINDKISEFLSIGVKETSREKEKRLEKQRRELELVKIQTQRIEESERLTRKKYWSNVKDDIYSKYQIPIADDAKKIAKELSDKNMLKLSKTLDTVSVFFITDERVVRQRYIEGGDKAIEKYAKHLTKSAFIGGPITATLLRRLKLLYEAKRDGRVIDTEIDIDGFVPHSTILYTIDKIELDGQKIPARRKFSIRCEMTATLTEGFRTGPFVYYDGLYLSNKEEMEQITDDDIEINKKREVSDASSTGKRYGKYYNINVCPHGTDKKSYCNYCHGDIIITTQKKIIGICMDISGSMDREKLENAKEAVIRVLERIPTGTNIHVVLIVFSGDLPISYREIIPFGKEYTESVKDMATKAIKRISSSGGTPLYDTINHFLDEIWHGIVNDDDEGLLEKFPYTYLIIVSDGDENGSSLDKLLYKGTMGVDGFFEKLKTYRDAGLVTEVIPFAYGYGGANNRLIRELRNISGKKLINKADPGNIAELMVSNVDSILYGSDDLKLVGMSIARKS